MLLFSNLKKLLPILLAVSFSACNEIEPPTPDVPRTTEDIVITFASSEYFAKLGTDLTITPSVEKAGNPVFAWTIDGKVVSNDLSLTFHADELGETYINFSVTTKNTMASKEIRVTVTDRDIPIIEMEDCYFVYFGKEVEIKPEVQNTDENTKYAWYVGTEQVCNEPSYKVFGKVANNIRMLFMVSNSAGISNHEFNISIMPEPVPILYFDNGEYVTPTQLNDPSYTSQMTVCIGQNLVMAPIKINMDEITSYSWSVDGNAQSATGEYFDFKPTAKGEYLVSVTGRCSSGEATARVRVVCTEEEGTHMRKATAESKYWANYCHSFIPAPGQFVNFQEGSTAEQARLTIQNKISNTDPGSYVASLGAFGGYVIFGFDHSVENKTGADLQINGNAFPGSNEPGVIWVMQDANGNGLPDDTWYELKGSETGNPDTKQRTAITYFRPNSDNANIIWISNTGATGTIDNNGYHKQRSYFPMFIIEESYTLTGTLLPENPSNTGLEGNSNFDWGYVDNINSKTGFYIEDAIQQDGSPANLKYIDFVKVHTGQQIKFAAIGEISTEPCVPIDLHLQ